MPRDIKDMRLFSFFNDVFGYGGAGKFTMNEQWTKSNKLKESTQGGSEKNVSSTWELKSKSILFILVTTDQLQQLCILPFSFSKGRFRLRLFYTFFSADRHFNSPRTKHGINGAAVSMKCIFFQNLKLNYVSVPYRIELLRLEYNQSVCYTMSEQRPHVSAG